MKALKTRPRAAAGKQRRDSQKSSLLKQKENRLRSPDLEPDALGFVFLKMIIS